MTQKTITAFIAFGSNLGEKQRNILNSLAAINLIPDTSVSRCSPMYESAPLDGSVQPSYLNGIAEIETLLAPPQLLSHLKAIEASMGRVQGGKWQPRVIDLDIIFYGDEIIRLPELQVPHKSAHLRSFVLEGMCALEPEKLHPVLNKTCRQLVQRLGGQNFFLKPDKAILIEMTGLIGVGKSTLAQGLAAKLNARILKEKYDENPYLPPVYEGRKELALKCELFFLENSLSQMSSQSLEAGKIYVADYIFEKSLIYPKLWLSDEDYAVFHSRYEQSIRQAAEPALVLNIVDTPSNCLDRIHQRSRKYEQDIKPQFLEHLMSEYENILNGWKKSPVITINAGRCDFRKQQCIDAVYEDVRHYITEI